MRQAALLLLLCAAFAAGARAQAPCCSVTAINAATGIVTAKVNANGAAFQFKVTNENLLKELRIGAGVYANFTSHEVSLDGKTIAGPITSGPAAAPAAPAPAPRPSLAPPAAAPSARPPTAAPPAGPAPDAAAPPRAALPSGASAPSSAAAAPLGASATRNLAAPAAAAAKAAASTAGQLPVITIAAGAPERTPASSTFNANRPRVEARTLTATANGKSTSAHITHIHGLDGVEAAQGLPDGVKELLLMHVKTLAAGESDDYIINTDLATEWAKTHPVSAAVKQAAQNTDSHTGCKSFSMHCAGEAEEHAEGQASDILKQAQDDWGHAATQLGHDWNVAADQVEACFADTRTNPLDLPVEFSFSLPSLITLDSSNVNSAMDALNVVNQINSGTYQPSSGDSGSGSSNLGSAELSGAASGFASGAGYGSGATGFPGAVAGAVKSAGASQTAAQAAAAASPSSSKDSPWSDNFKGKIVFGFPELSSTGTMVHADFFYIPCLPFLVRPRSVGVTGSLGVEAAITGNAQASGQYNKTIPLPTADLHIPIQVWPIVLPNGTPIAEIDLSLFVQGFLQITAKGQLTSSFNLDYVHTTGFGFTCDGKGCTPTQPSRSQVTKIPAAPAPTTTTEVSGEIQVQPKLFTGLEINVDVDAIQARVGPEATLEGDVQGDACLSTAGAVRTTSDALLAELGWTPSMRADLLMFTTAIGNGYNKPLEPERMLEFQDLLQGRGGSSALTPGVTGQAKVTPGQAATYDISMPACYPYPDQVNYHVSWTGGGLTAGSKSCSVPSAVPPATTPPLNELNCVFNPKQALALSLAWPQASTTDYSITVEAVGDQLGRKFNSAKPAVVPVSVAAK